MLKSLLLITHCHNSPWQNIFIDYAGAPILLQQLHDETSSSVGEPQFSLVHCVCVLQFVVVQVQTSSSNDYRSNTSSWIFLRWLYETFDRTDNWIGSQEEEQNDAITLSASSPAGRECICQSRNTDIRGWSS